MFETPDGSLIAQQAEHALHRPSSSVERDSVPSVPAQCQTSSKRTTTDSVLDRLLHEVDAAALFREPTAAQATSIPPSDAGRRNTADTVLHTVPSQGNNTTGPQLTASNPMQSSNSRRSSASGAAGGVQPLLSRLDPVKAQSGRRSTTDSVLASVLDEVEHEVEDDAAQASIDSLLDGVLTEVAGAASRQRTTADSVLDAMLDDISSSQMDVQSNMERQSSSEHSAQADRLQQQQLQAVSCLPSAIALAHCVHWQSGYKIQFLEYFLTALNNIQAVVCSTRWLACLSVCLSVCLVKPLGIFKASTGIFQ